MDNGTIEIVVKGMEGVHGHPCAVFEVSGSYVESQKDNGQGQTVGGEATIDKGKIWCSLLYPIVLRSDLDLIVSWKTLEGGKLVSQMQGTVNHKMHRDWKVVTKKPKKPKKPAPAPAPAKPPEKK